MTDLSPCPFFEVQSADRQHVPDLEQAAENQRPKTRDHREPKLYRYVGTDLYQWYSKRNPGPFEDPCDVPFVIKGAATASPECGPTGHLDEPIPSSNRRAEDRRGGEAEEALCAIRNQLGAAKSSLMYNERWTNEAGYITDAALWIERAISAAETALAAPAASPSEASDKGPGKTS